MDLDDQEYECPLSLVPWYELHEPVVASDGILYEKMVIDDYINKYKDPKKKLLSPVTNLRMNKTPPTTCTSIATIAEVRRKREDFHKAQRSKLQKEKDTMQSALIGKLEEQAKKIEMLEDKAKKSDAERSKLQMEKDENHAKYMKKIEMLEDKAKKSDAERSKLQREKDETHAKYMEMAMENLKLKKETKKLGVTAMKEKIKSLEGKLSSYKNTCHSQLLEINKIRGDHGTVIKKLEFKHEKERENLENDIDRMRKEINRKRAQLDQQVRDEHYRIQEGVMREKEKNEFTIKSLNETVKLNKKTNDSLSSTIKSLEKKIGELMVFKHRYKASQVSQQHVCDDFDEYKRKKCDELKTMEQTIKTLRLENAEIRGLKETIDTLKKMRENDAVTPSNQKWDELSSRNVDLIARIKKLQDELTQAVRSREMLSDLNEHINKTNATLKNEVKECYKDANERLAGQRKEMAGIIAKKESVIQEREDTIATLKKMREQEKSAAPSTSWKDLSARNAKLITDNKRMAEEAKVQDEVVSKLQKEKQELEREMEKKEDILANQNKIRNNIREKLNESENTNGRLKDMRAREQAEWNESVTSYNRTIQQTKVYIENLEKTRDDLKKMLEKSMTSSHEVVGVRDYEIRRLSRKIETLESDNAALVDYMMNSNDATSSRAPPPPPPQPLSQQSRQADTPVYVCRAGAGIHPPPPKARQQARPQQLQPPKPPLLQESKGTDPSSTSEVSSTRKRGRYSDGKDNAKSVKVAKGFSNLITEGLVESEKKGERYHYYDHYKDNAHFASLFSNPSKSLYSNPSNEILTKASSKITSAANATKSMSRIVSNEESARQGTIGQESGRSRERSTSPNSDTSLSSGSSRTTKRNESAERSESTNEEQRRSLGKEITAMSNKTKTLTKEREQWICAVCKVECSHSDSFVEHCCGKKHMKNNDGKRGFAGLLPAKNGAIPSMSGSLMMDIFHAIQKATKRDRAKRAKKMDRAKEAYMRDRAKEAYMRDKAKKNFESNSVGFDRKRLSYIGEI